MWNFILLFVCTVSGTCSTPEDIFTQVETINSLQTSANLVAEKPNKDETTVCIHPEGQGFVPGLDISVQDIRKNNSAYIKISRGEILLTSIEITRYPTNDSEEELLLNVCDGGTSQRFATVRYYTNGQNVQNIQEPQATLVPHSIQRTIPEAEIRCDLPRSKDGHTYALVVSMLLHDLPRFDISCETTKQERKLFKLTYHPSKMVPTRIF